MIPTQFTQRQPARNKEAAGWVLSLTLCFIWEPHDQGYVDLPRRTTSISNQNRWNLKRPDHWSKRIVSSCMLKDTGLHIIYFIQAHLKPFSVSPFQAPEKMTLLLGDVPDVFTTSECSKWRSVKGLRGWEKDGHCGVWFCGCHPNAQSFSSIVQIRLTALGC